MVASLVSADDILKDFYVAPIQDQLNNNCEALQMFQEETVQWQGRVAIVPLSISRNTGTGFRAEGQPLPTAGRQGYGKLEVPARFGYGNFSFTGPALEFTEGGGSFEPVMSGEMKRLATDVKVMLDQACYTGSQCIGAVWQKQAAGTVWQYTGRPDNTINPAWGVGIGVGHNVRFVSIRTGNFVGVATQVNAITESVLTLNAAINTAVGVADAGGFLIEQGDAFSILHLDADRNAEMSGIFDNLTNPQFYNMNRVRPALPAVDVNAALRTNFLVSDFTAAAPTWQDLSLDALQILMDKVLLTGAAEVDGMLINPVLRQSYTTLLQGTAAGVPTAAQLDVTGGAKKGDGGFSSLGYANIPFKTGIHAPKGTVFMLNRKFWSTFQKQPGSFADKNGAILRPIAGLDEYEGYWRHYLNIVTKRPNANGLLLGVSYYGV